MSLSRLISIMQRERFILSETAQDSLPKAERDNRKQIQSRSESENITFVDFFGDDGETRS